MGTSEVLGIMGITPLHIIIFIVIVIISFIILEYNKFVRLNNKIKQSKSSIDVYLNQRFDLIPNLVECVKAYCKHEENVFSKVAQMRAEYNKDQDKNLKKGAELNNGLNEIRAIGENNPDLQANEQFINLQKNLTKMESQLQAARRVYNGDVTLYNTTIQAFPNNFFARIFNFKEQDLFEIEEYKKENINIDL